MLVYKGRNVCTPLIDNLKKPKTTQATRKKLLLYWNLFHLVVKQQKIVNGRETPVGEVSYEQGGTVSILVLFDTCCS